MCAIAEGWHSSGGWLLRSGQRETNFYLIVQSSCEKRKMADKAVHGIQESVERLVSDLEKNNLRPAQKRHFLCSAKCCDVAGYGQQELQQCMHKCSEPVMVMEQTITAQLSQFQERLQRCMIRCQDTARDQLPASPSEKHIAKAQSQVEGCVADCAKQYTAQIPKLKSEIQASIKNL